MSQEFEIPPTLKSDGTVMPVEVWVVCGAEDVREVTMSKDEALEDLGWFNRNGSGPYTIRRYTLAGDE